MATQATNARHDNAWLRDLLVRALRSRGLRAVCKGEPFTLAGDLADRMSIAVMSALWLGVAASVADWLDATTTEMVLIALLLAGALGVTGVRAGPGRAAIVLVLLWIVALVVQLVHADDDVVETIGVPFVITTGAVAIFHAPRIAAIARSAPLVLAVALTVLVIPLFTNDMWAAVAKLHAGNVFAVAALTLLPTLFLVEKRLRSKVAPTVEARAPDGRHGEGPGAGDVGQGPAG